MAQSLGTARKHSETSQVHGAYLPRRLVARSSGRLRTARVAVVSLMLLAPLFAHAAIVHVDGGAVGSDDGSSWSDAYTDLQDALATAESGDEIWVATGVYKPTEGADRAATFQLENGVEIYGGFDGMETARNQRDPEVNITVLSGDIDGNDTTDANGVVLQADNIVGDNSFHVVIGSDTDNTAVLDGFTITAGDADESTVEVDDGGGMLNESGSPNLVDLIFSGNTAPTGGGMLNGNDSNPILTNVTFSGNSALTGGGMYNNNNSAPVLTDVIFSDNTASNFIGGGMRNSNSSPILTNVTFKGNSATGNGGGMANSSSNPVVTSATFSGNSSGSNGGGMSNEFDSNPVLTNVTFSGNSASSNGGGVFNRDESIPTIRNTIFWNNVDGSGTGTAAASVANSLDGSSSIISYSLVQGCKPEGTWQGECGSDNGNNLTDIDPLHVDTPDPGAAPTTAGNLRLQSDSPVIDAGHDDFITDIDGATDLDGHPRLLSEAVDLGAYEFPEALLEVGTDGAGTVSLDPDQALYMLGTPVEITANEHPGWTFSDWSGDLTGTTNPAIFIVDNDTTITATFSKDPPIVDPGINQTVAIGSPVTLDGSGSYDEDPDQTLSYLWVQSQGDTVALGDPTAVQPTFTAPSQPDQLSFALLVTNDLEKSAAGAVTITVRSEFEVSASVASGAGSISPASQTVEAGADADFSVIPDDGWYTSTVTGDTCDPTRSDAAAWVAANITANCSVTAVFEAIGVFQDRFEESD